MKLNLKYGGLVTSAAALALSAGLANAQQVFATDVIVQGSLCSGFDCVNGESFGFDTLRLKENNLRIHFNDTSTSASFPSNDWRLLANETGNGGANYLAIEDSSAGRIPFRVEAGAAANSLVVEADGDVGMGTLDPVVEMHVRDGDTPTLRLEQDGSSGFTPQTFDVAANETNFFVRNVTNGSQLPFRIKPGSGNDDAIVIAANGDVGMGTDNPGAPLHVLTANSGVTDGGLFVENTNGTAGARVLGGFKNNGTLIVQFTEASNGTDFSWNMQVRDDAGGNEFRLVNSTGVGEELRLSSDGNMTLTGTLTTATTVYPDYVFDEDYDLMPLSEVQEFITANGHLPNIPKAEDIISGGLDLTAMHIKVMEKVEELTLYTLQQQALIESLQAELETQQN